MLTGIILWPGGMDPSVRLRLSPTMLPNPPPATAAAFEFPRCMRSVAKRAMIEQPSDSNSFDKTRLLLLFAYLNFLAACIANFKYPPQYLRCWVLPDIATDGLFLLRCCA